jgi:hypothetical protein
MLPQDDFVRLEYRGRMPRVVPNALKERHDVGKQHAPRDVGQNVLVLEVQRWETNIPRYACGEPFADCSYVLVPDTLELQTRSNFLELVVRFDHFAEFYNFEESVVQADRTMRVGYRAPLPNIGECCLVLRRLRGRAPRKYSSRRSGEWYHGHWNSEKEDSSWEWRNVWGWWHGSGHRG